MIHLIISKLKMDKNDSLSRIVKKNTFFLLLLKIFSVLLGLLSVKISFDFTETQQVYGLWLTLISVVSWLGLLDGGLGNGLRNKLSLSLAENNKRKAKTYISTSYIIIGLISLSSIILYTMFTIFFDWRVLFNAHYISKISFAIVFSIVVVSYLVQLALSTINAVCFAFNLSMIPSLFTFISNLIFVISLYILKCFGLKGLFILGFVYSVSILIVLFLGNVYLFSTKYKDIRPSVSCFDKNCVKELMGNGIKFFFLQISAVIIFTTDSIIINDFVSSQEVTTYQLVMKLFNVFLIISGIVMTPLWSAFTQAYSNNNMEWIVRVIKKVLTMMIPVVCGVILLSIFVNLILKIWIGHGVVASNALIFVIAIYIVINIWSNIFAYFLNGVGQINGQLITVGLGAIVNAPLSIFLAHFFGSTGVVSGTILSLLPFAIYGPVNSYKIIKEKNRFQ